MEPSVAIITCILSSTVAAAVVTSIKELVIWFLNRKAKLADDSAANQSENLETILTGLVDSVKALETKLNLSLENDKIILKDKIKYLILKYVDIGEITLDEKQAIQHMWHIYHYDLKGNGDLNDFMEMLEDITIVKSHNINGGIYR